MPPIDDLLSSVLVSEIAGKLGASTSAGRKIIVPFEALALAGQIDIQNEAAFASLMAELAIARSWTIKVYFIARVAEFSD